MKYRKYKLMITWQFPLKGFEFSWTKVQSEIKWVIQELKLCLNTNSGRKRNLSKYWTKNLSSFHRFVSNQRRNSAWINIPMCTGILWISGVWSLTQQTFLCVVARSEEMERGKRQFVLSLASVTSGLAMSVYVWTGMCYEDMLGYRVS